MSPPLFQTLCFTVLRSRSASSTYAKWHVWLLFTGESRELHELTTEFYPQVVLFLDYSYLNCTVFFNWLFFLGAIYSTGSLSQNYSLCTFAVSLSTTQIQPENQTVSMDKCHLSSAPMLELQWLSSLEHLTGIQRTQVQILVGSQCLFA